MRALLTGPLQQLQKLGQAGYADSSEKTKPVRVKPCLLPLSYEREDISKNNLLPDRCIGNIWGCLELKEQASASSASTASRRAAPAPLRLAAAAQRFCGSGEKCAATRDLRALTELAADERAVLWRQIPAVLALNIDLVRCQGAPLPTRVSSIRNLGRVLRCPKQLPDIFAAYDSSTNSPAVVVPALEALLWAASQDQDRMRHQALGALAAIAKGLVSGIRETFENPTKQRQDVAAGSRWAVAWTERQAREEELRVDIAAFCRSSDTWYSERCQKGGQISDVAQFLSNHRLEIDSAKLGTFLGKHQDVMIAFIEQSDLAGVSIVPAFSRVLSGVEISGEAQLVDRFCEHFGRLWGEANGIDPDNAYIFAFSLVMLSTDLHRPADDKKHEPMSFEQFSKNLKGALTGSPLPDRMLRRAYRQLRNGALFVRDDAEPGPSQLCQRLQRSLCCPPKWQSMQTEHLSEDLPGLWRTVWSAAWRPLLGAFTVGASYQGGEKDEANLEVAMRGLQCGCQAAGLLGEAIQTEAFSTALQKLSPA